MRSRAGLLALMSSLVYVLVATGEAFTQTFQVPSRYLYFNPCRCPKPIDPLSKAVNKNWPRVSPLDDRLADVNETLAVVRSIREPLFAITLGSRDVKKLLTSDIQRRLVAATEQGVMDLQSVTASLEKQDLLVSVQFTKSLSTSDLRCTGALRGRVSIALGPTQPKPNEDAQVSLVLRPEFTTAFLSSSNYRVAHGELGHVVEHVNNALKEMLEKVNTELAPLTIPVAIVNTAVGRDNNFFVTGVGGGGRVTFSPDAIRHYVVYIDEIGVHIVAEAAEEDSRTPIVPRPVGPGAIRSKPLLAAVRSEVQSDAVQGSLAKTELSSQHTTDGTPYVRIAQQAPGESSTSSQRLREAFSSAYGKLTEAFWKLRSTNMEMTLTGDPGSSSGVISKLFLGKWLKKLGSPISSLEQRMRAVDVSLVTANAISDPAFGVSTGKDQSVGLLLQAIKEKIPYWKEQKIVTLKDPKVTLGKQEIALSVDFEKTFESPGVAIKARALGTVAVDIEGDEKTHLASVMLRPAFKTIEILEATMNDGQVGFPLVPVLNKLISAVLERINGTLPPLSLNIAIPKPTPISVSKKQITFDPLILGRCVTLIDSDGVHAVGELRSPISEEAGSTAVTLPVHSEVTEELFESQYSKLRDRFWVLRATNMDAPPPSDRKRPSVSVSKTFLANYLNKNFPPKSFLAIRLEAVDAALAKANAMDSPTFGARFRSDFVKSLINSALETARKKNKELSVITQTDIEFGKQEVRLSTVLEKKFEKPDVKIKGRFTGLVYPSVEGNNLMLTPALRDVELEEATISSGEVGIELTSSLNKLIADLRQNINGALEALPIDLVGKPIDPVDATQVLQPPKNVDCTKEEDRKKEFRCGCKDLSANQVPIPEFNLGRAAVLVDPAGIHLVGELFSEKVPASAGGSLTSPTPLGELTEERFEQAYQSLVAKYTNIAESHLDKLALPEQQNSASVAISKSFVASVLNKTLEFPNLCFNCNVPKWTDGGWKDLRLHKEHPDDCTPDRKCVLKTSDKKCTYERYDRDCSQRFSTRDCEQTEDCSSSQNCNMNCGRYDFWCHRKQDWCYLSRDAAVADCERLKLGRKWQCETEKGIENAGFAMEYADCKRIEGTKNLEREIEQKRCEAEKAIENASNRLAYLDCERLRLQDKIACEAGNAGDHALSEVSSLAIVIWEAGASVNLEGCIFGFEFSPKLDEVKVHLQLRGTGDLSADVTYIPKPFLGGLICMTPWQKHVEAQISLDRELHHIGGTVRSEVSQDGDMKLILETEKEKFNFNMEPSPYEALVEENPEFWVSCPIGTVLGEITRTVSLFTRPEWDWIFSGAKRHEMDRQKMVVPLKPYEIKYTDKDTGDTLKVLLNPAWGEKAISFAGVLK